MKLTKRLMAAAVAFMSHNNHFNCSKCNFDCLPRPATLQVNPLQAQWPFGTLCEAMWNGTWYEATVQGHTQDAVMVKYTGYDDVAEVRRPSLKLSTRLLHIKCECFCVFISLMLPS